MTLLFGDWFTSLRDTLKSFMAGHRQSKTNCSLTYFVLFGGMNESFMCFYVCPLRDKWSIQLKATIISSAVSRRTQRSVLMSSVLPFPEQPSTSGRAGYSSQGRQHQPPPARPSHCPAVVAPGQLHEPHRNSGQRPQAEHPAGRKE